MRINIRFDQYDYEIICVRCLQEIWLEKGMESFKSADFFSYKDLANNGFVKYGNYFCRSEQSYKDVENIFNELKENGKLVILNINSSGMNLEFHVSIFTK